MLARLSRKGYPPVFPCALGNICIGMYGIFFYLGRLFSNPEAALIGVVFVSCGFHFAIKFFTMLVGPLKGRNKYVIVASMTLVTVTVVSVFLEPASFTDHTVVFSPLERVGMFGMLVLLLAVQREYITTTVRRVRGERLEPAFLVFPALIVVSVILILVLYPLTIAQLLPTYAVIIPPFIMFATEAAIVARFPAALFMSPSLLLMVEVRDTGKNMLYRRTFPGSDRTGGLEERVQRALDGIGSSPNAGHERALKVQKIVFDDITVLVKQTTVASIYMAFKNQDNLMDKAFVMFSRSTDAILSKQAPAGDRNIKQALDASFTNAFSFLPALHERNE